MRTGDCHLIDGDEGRGFCYLVWSKTDAFLDFARHRSKEFFENSDIDFLLEATQRCDSRAVGYLFELQVALRSNEREHYLSRMTTDECNNSKRDEIDSRFDEYLRVRVTGGTMSITSCTVDGRTIPGDRCDCRVESGSEVCTDTDAVVISGPGVK